MDIRTVALAVILSLSSLVLVGCQTTELFPESPYFGVGNNSKRYVPKELQEQQEIR